jgi:hypothetical protein
MTLLRDLPPDERERITSVIWAPQEPRSPTCDYCGEFRPFIRNEHGEHSGGQWPDREQCYCEPRRRASRPQEAT